MGSSVNMTGLLFVVGIYIVLFVLVVILVLAVKRISRSQQEISATHKDIAKQLALIVNQLERKNS